MFGLFMWVLIGFGLFCLCRFWYSCFVLLYWVGWWNDFCAGLVLFGFVWVWCCLGLPGLLRVASVCV